MKALPGHTNHLRESVVYHELQQLLHPNHQLFLQLHLTFAKQQLSVYICVLL